MRNASEPHISAKLFMCTNSFEYTNKLQWPISELINHFVYVCAIMFLTNASIIPSVPLLLYYYIYMILHRVGVARKNIF